MLISIPASDGVECAKFIDILSERVKLTGKLAAFVEIESDNSYTATVCDNRQALFKTDKFIRQSDLIDSLDDCPNVVVIPFNDFEYRWH